MNGEQVRLLGRPRVEVAAGEPPRRQPRGRKSWALLARVALAERAVPRSELSGALFATADDPLAALRWSLADVRACLARSDVLRGDPVSLAADGLSVDVWALEDGSLPNDDLGGLLLEGIELRDCPEFTSWLLTARARCAARTRAELRERAMRLLASGDCQSALDLASRAARLDPLDESAQELFLRALVADGQGGLALAQLAVCEGMFAREGVPVSSTLRAAAQDRAPRSSGVRAGIVAASLLEAGQAALDAGAADAGIETLRRAADDAARADDVSLEAQILHALGAALVHAVRGGDGEGALVLHRALRAARHAQRPALLAEILRELAFVDVQAGRHEPAARALAEAAQTVAGGSYPALAASIAAIDGMNRADRGRHLAAAALLTESAAQAEVAGRPRQRAWSLGLLARSLLLSGQLDDARDAAEASIALVRAHRWNAFLPWPQAIRAECLIVVGQVDAARVEAEKSFALGCELGDPCWEGMAARVLGVLAWHDGDHDLAWQWLRDARVRSDRVSDRYVWVSGYIRLAQLELAAQTDRALAGVLAGELHEFAVAADLPEFQAWALVHRNAPGDLGLARSAAWTVDNPALRARVEASEA
jgi:DNA-binding SARP family transcriptional activator